MELGAHSRRPVVMDHKVVPSQWLVAQALLALVAI
jgi:hypothetical protein